MSDHASRANHSTLDPALYPQLRRLLPIDQQHRLLPHQILDKTQAQAIHHHLVRLLTSMRATVPQWILTAHDASQLPVRGVSATLLFADVTGFTALTERLNTLGRVGNEHIMHLLNQSFARLVAVARAWGGDLLAYGGDAMLVLFEGIDHAARAATAAWEMQSAMAREQRDSSSFPFGLSPLQLKIGLASGPIVLSVSGTSARQVPMALGSVLDTTDTMANATAPDGIRLDPCAAALARAWLDLLPQPDGSALLRGIRHAPTRPIQVTPPDLSQRSLHHLLADCQTLEPLLPPSILATLVGAPDATPGDGEQRRVISLFTHIAGLHTLADQLEPQQAQLVADLADRVIVPAIKSIEQYGGVLAHVDTYSGGHKLLALFGAPIAHEHDMLHAVQAALRWPMALPDINTALATMLAEATPSIRHPPTLHVRSGLNNGAVVAGLLGSPLRYEYTVIGDAVNIAARLMSNAALDAAEVLVGPGIAAELRNLLIGTPRTLMLKGKRASIETLVVHMVQEMPPRSLQGTPLVGRTPEYAALRTAAGALSAGQHRLVFLQGEPGIGKTRLARELLELLDDTTHILQIGSPGMMPPTFGLFRDLLLTLCVLPRTATAAQIREHLPVVLARFVAEPRMVMVRSAAFGVLLGLPEAEIVTLGESAEAQQRTLAQALASLLVAVAQTQPLAIFVDDLHETDAPSLTLLGYLLPLLDRIPLLLCATLRSTPTLPTGDLHGIHNIIAAAQARDETTIVYLPLTGLDHAAGQTLLDTLLPGVSPTVQDVLLHHTDGNPLFLELLTEAIQVQGALRPGRAGFELRAALEMLAVPLTLHELVAAQLDRIPAEVRRLAQLAAVVAAVDRTFPASLLTTLADDPHTAQVYLEELLRTRILNTATDVQLISGETYHYTFRHALFQQVAYARLLERERIALHHRIGSVLHEQEGVDADRHLTTLAYHCYEGQAWSLALHYNLLAGARAQQLYAHHEARRSFRRALGIARRLRQPDEEATAREGLGALHAFRGNFSVANAEITRAFSVGAMREGTSKQLEAQARRCRLLSLIGERTGNYAQAEAHCRTGLQLTAKLSLPNSEIAHLYAQLAEVLLRQGAFDQAESACYDGLAALSPESVLLRERVILLQRLGTIAIRRGRYTDALAILTQSLAVARAAADPALIATILNNSGLGHYYAGRYDDARRYFQESLAINEQIHDTIGSIGTMNSLGQLYQTLGEPENALRCFNECQTLSRQFHVPDMLALAAMNIGALMYEHGDMVRARKNFNQAQATYSKLNDSAGQADCLYRLGDVALAQQQPEEARMCAINALSLAQHVGSQSLESCALRVLGEARLAQHHIDEAHRHLEHAWQIQQQVGDPYDEAFILAALARLALMRSEKAQASLFIADAMERAQKQNIGFLIKNLEALNVTDVPARYFNEG